MRHNDLPERLRAQFVHWNTPPSPELPDGSRILLEAAEHIEQLRFKLRDVQATFQMQSDALKFEIEAWFDDV